jgi:DNA replication protein DnaC
MERLGDAIARIRPRLQARIGDAPPEPEPEPSCPMCKDHGFVRREVPIGDPDFGRAIPCECRIGELRDRLRRRSNLGPLASRSFDSFRTDGRDGTLSEPSRRKAEAALEVCRSYAEAPVAWLVLAGPSGCGKTHLAAAIAGRQIELGVEVFFTVVPDLLDHLRATYAPGSDVTYDELFESVRNAPLLILDDLGTQSETSWAQEKMFQVLNHRFNSELPTVITTNHPVDELEERLRARLKNKESARIIEVQDRDTVLESLLHSDWKEGLLTQTFDTFQWPLKELTQRQNRTLAGARDAAVDFAANPRGWLVLVGDVGRGKTHLAAAIKNYLDLHGGETVIFITVLRLLDHLRATYAPASPVTYDRAFDRFLNVRVLILDDYGTHSSKPWAEEKMFQLINHRFNARLPTVITTNIRFDEPESLPPAGQQELRIFSRILDRELSRIVRIDSVDFRHPELNLRRRRDRAY